MADPINEALRGNDSGGNPEDKAVPTGPSKPSQTQSPDRSVAAKYVTLISLLQTLTPLLRGVAWPITAIILVTFTIYHADYLFSTIDRFMRGKQSLEVSANRQGVQLKVLQGLKVQANSAGAQLVEKEFAKWGIDVSSAICRLNREPTDRGGPI